MADKSKTVSGHSVDRSEFAYVGDPNDSSTWKLPIDTEAHIRNALARVNQTQGIPPRAKHQVLEKIRHAAHEHGITVSSTATPKQKAAGFNTKK